MVDEGGHRVAGIPRLGMGLSASWDDGGLQVGDATHVVRREGRVVGAVFGLLTADEADALVGRLIQREDPGATVPEVPWAAVAARPDATVAATCSMMLSSGLFHRSGTDPPADAADGLRRPVGWSVATDPVALLGGPVAEAPDNTYLGSFAAAEVPLHRTPYARIRRTPAGETLLLRLGAKLPVFAPWCTPATLGEPFLDGPEAITAYLELFDQTVAVLAGRTSPLVAHVSGGLDSTFVAASLARGLDASRVVRGLCHSPVPGRAQQSPGRWDPDDYPWARLMQAAYPGRLTVEPVRNTGGVHPLDAAANAAQFSGIPTYAPANQVWMHQTSTIAARAGAAVIFAGVHGNAAYSDRHAYAPRWYLDRRNLPGLAGLARDIVATHARPLSGLRRDFAAPLRRRGAPGEGLDGRARYLAFLTRRSSGHAAAMNPAGQGGLLTADPYLSRPLIELAAAITPRRWQRGPLPRAFARTLAEGRVPDPIRLRTRRGGQAMDTWYVVATQPERMDTAVQLAADCEQFRGWLDADALTTWWATARGRDPWDPPPLTELNQALRLAAAAEFAHTMART